MHSYQTHYSPERELATLPRIYTREMAIRYGDVVFDYFNTYNTHQLHDFMDNIKKGNADKIRVTRFGIDGPATTSILLYRGNTLRYTIDHTRHNQNARFDTYYGNQIFSRIEQRDGLTLEIYYLSTHDNTIVEIIPKFHPAT